MGFEHRKSLRVKVDRQLFFWPEGLTEKEGLWGRTVDMSVSGLAFHCGQALPKDSRHQVEFMLPGEPHPVRLMVKVVLCDGAQAGGQRLIRTQFSGLEGEERQRVQQAILTVADPALALASGWGKAYFPELPAMELRYREMPPGLRAKWLEDRSYLDIKGLIYLKHFQDHLETMLGSRQPGAFRILGSRALKEGSSVWVELALPMGQLHCLAQALWCKQAPGERAESGLQLQAFQKEEALRLEKSAQASW